MLRRSGIWLVTLCCVFAVFSAAHAAAAPEGQTGTTAACPDCGMTGELCPDCTAQAQAFLGQMAGDMCPNCEPAALCEVCKSAVAGALAKLPTLTVTSVDSEPMQVAYLAGKAGDDQHALITSMVEEAAKQGLLGPETMVGSLYPDVMAQGYSPESPVYACVNLPEGASPAAPLAVYAIPAGRYLQVDHWGDYAQLGVTWMAAFAYADLHGITFSDGPAGELYLTDPETAPMDKWLTEVYIPLADTADSAPVGHSS